MNYHKYLCSSHWLKFRQEALEHYGKKCADCGTEHAKFDVHHLSYNRLGREELADVVVLCHKCHKLRHEIERCYDGVYCSCQNAIPSTVLVGGHTFFAWQCKDCKKLISLYREPSEEELQQAERYKQKCDEKMAKEFEKQQIRDKKKAERLAAKEEADRLAGKKKRPKPLKKIKRKIKDK